MSLDLSPRNKASDVGSRCEVVVRINFPQLRSQSGGEEGCLHLDAIWMRANTVGPLEEMPERQIKSCKEIAEPLK